MDYKKIFETLVERTQQYIEANGLKSMVLGISGGLDSTVTAAICHQVELRNPEIKFYGVSLPGFTNSKDENASASLAMCAYCKEKQRITQEIQGMFAFMRSIFEESGSLTKIGQGNIKARIRMMYLYDLAQKTQGLVMDTDNLTEHYLGFFTIHGDVGDLNPIGKLWKHEVYELAQYLLDSSTNELERYALSSAIGIQPTDGNGVKSGGDMAQIAPRFVKLPPYEAYKNVDEIIHCALSNEDMDVFDKLSDKYDKETINHIIQRIKRTEFKRKRLPVRINLE